MKRPTKCPICGNKIVKVTNAVTKNSYFKCANKECRFVLGSNFTEAEFYLQGRELKTGCIHCGENLKVVNGPKGLYGICTHCDCDSRPTSYNGKIYHKWVNAIRTYTKDEISDLIKTFNLGKENTTKDIPYDFETYIASKVAAEPTESKVTTKRNKESKEQISDRILNLLNKDTLKPYSIFEISEGIGESEWKVRPWLTYLQANKSIKIVGAILTPSTNHTLQYQVVESKLPSIPIYSQEDGYTGIVTFAKNNTKYGSVPTVYKKLQELLKKRDVKPSLFDTGRGVRNGYKVDLMHELLNPKSGMSKKDKVDLMHELLNPKSSMSKKEIKEANKNKIISLLKNNLSVAFTSDEIIKKLHMRRDIVKELMRELRSDKQIKAVGWMDSKKHKGAIALKYQLTKSPLVKFKTSKDNNKYMTATQFYRKKLNGKKGISLSQVMKEVAGLPVTPLIVNHRAYAGYSVTDLNETLSKFVSSKKTGTKKSSAKKRTSSIDVDVVTAALLSSEKQKEVETPKKKSIFSSITSFFRKGVKVPS